MKSFIICMETAFIAFCAGIIIGAAVEEQKYKQNEEASEEDTPA